jgi:hypothetical protein
MKTASSLAPIGSGRDFRRRLGRLAELLADNDSQYTPETERLLDDIAAYMMAGGEMNPAGWVDFLRPFGQGGKPSAIR